MEKNKIDNILIVDDQPANIRVLSTMLSSQNYKVRKSVDGKSALSAIQLKAPDLILLDIKMPGIDGYEVCSTVKSDPETADIPIIFISALHETTNKVKAFELGAIDYITKPFQEEEVLARIKNQLTIKKQQILLQEEKKLLALKQKRLVVQQKKLEQEIKQRKEIEATLGKSRALISNILMSSFDGIAALEARRSSKTKKIEDFSCLISNPIIANIFERSVDDLNQNLFSKKFLETFAPHLFSFSAFVDVVETGVSLEKEFSCQAEDQEQWYHLAAVKLGDGIALTIRDITARKKSELELNYLATIDGLTGVSNRRTFDRTLEKEWHICQREQNPLSLILCDVDYFKAYNDYYGHQAGDDCLKKIADTLKTTIKRPADLVARYGGEEFAIILSNTPNYGATYIGTEILTSIENLQLPHAGSCISNYITVSLGIATIVPSVEITKEILVKQADLNLYKAKNTGRNCFVTD